MTINKSQGQSLSKQTLLKNIPTKIKIHENIFSIVPLYNSLIDFIQYVREHFDDYENKSIELINKDIEYQSSRKKKTPKSRHLDDTNFGSEERQLDSRAKFMSDIHYVICDKFIAELNKRKMAYIEVEKKFGFLLNKNPDRKEIINEIKNLQSMYTNELDLDPDNFADEWLQFHSLISSHQISRNSAAQLKFIKDMQILHAF
ncbi:hypothetical protein QTP88_000590 [Uroleucon formosanum]